MTGRKWKDRNKEDKKKVFHKNKSKLFGAVISA